jgi:hypothetical protein
VTRRACLGLVGALGLSLLAFGCGGSHSSGGAPAATFILSPANDSTLADGTVGVPYTQPITVVSGGTPPYTFMPVALPPGLSLVPQSGTEIQLSGTPTQSVVKTKVEFQVIDSTNSHVGNQDYILSVN